MENTLLNTIIDERITKMPSEKNLKRHTRWIAQQSTVPIINGVFGAYLNPYCHAREAYDQNYLSKLNK
jgi:hypothetical protein